MNFFVAATSIDITPSPGLWMTGFAARLSPSTGKHDSLKARFLFLYNAENPIIIISCDLIGIEVSLANDIRKRIASAIGFNQENIMLTFTHTHPAACSLPFRGIMGHVDYEWLNKIADDIVREAIAIPAKMQPAKYSYGASIIKNIGFNRQDRSRDYDDELRVIRFTTNEDKHIATIVNYATHAVMLGPKNTEYSADYPGYISNTIEKEEGGVCLFLAGACGDVDPQIHLEKGWGNASFDDLQNVADKFYTEIKKIENTRKQNSELLTATSKIINVPMDAPPTLEQLAKIKENYLNDLEKFNLEPNKKIDKVCTEAMLEWVAELESALKNNTVPKTIPTELNIISIGNIRIIGLPFELYSDIGLTLKNIDKDKFVIVVGYANGIYGYCATDLAKAQGGYGADSSCRWFPKMLTAVGCGAETLIEKTVKELL